MHRPYGLYLTAVASALTYIQSEVTMTHTAHVVASAVLVFLAGVGIVPPHVPTHVQDKTGDRVSVDNGTAG